MQPKEFEPVYEKVKGEKARQARKEMHKDFKDFNWWRKLKGMAEWLCLILVETYWIIFEGILAWKEDQWEMEIGKETNAMQIYEVKRKKVDFENLAEEGKPRKYLKDQSLIREEEETLLSYLDKLSVGGSCVEQKGILQTYDEVAKHSQEVAIPEVFFDEEETRDVEEEFLNNLVNYQNSSEEHEELIIEALNEDPCIFETDMLCMFSGLTSDEQQLDNVLMHVDEEVRLLEEMDEKERYLSMYLIILRMMVLTRKLS